MDINDYIDPVELDKPNDEYISGKNLFGKFIKINTASQPIDDLNKYTIAILGVPEDRNSINKGCSLSPDIIRTYLYQLYKMPNIPGIIDLGNLKQGNTFHDTYYGLKDVILELLNNELVTIIIGGSQDLTYALHLAYEEFKDKINLTTVDSRIDFQKEAIRFNSLSYLNEIILNKSKRLFRYINIGNQQYLTDNQDITYLNNLFYETLRLGIIRSNISGVEPYLRDSDLVSFDIGAIRQSDAPANQNSSPNGFYSEEACHIARYAGMSDKISAFGLFEVNPKYERHDQTAKLTAQMIWFFLEGFILRNAEDPASKSNDFKTFIISHAEMDHDITFYKSMKSERWWMEIPDLKNNKNIVVACSYTDYEQACNHEIPDIWWKAFQRLN